MKSTKEFIVEFITRCQKNRNSQYSFILKRDYPNIIQEVTTKCPSNNISQSLFNFVNDIVQIPLCTNCKNNVVSFINYTKGYHLHCSRQCSDKSQASIKSRKVTNLRKYGHSNYCQSTEGISRKKKSCIEKYGVDHFSKTKEFTDKFITTMMKRYNVEYAMQSTKLKNKFVKSMQHNHGVNHPSQSSQMYQNRNNAMKEKYGFEHAMQCKELVEKHKQSVQLHYGVDYPIQSSKVQDTMKSTMMEKYGKEYSAQVDFIFEKLKQTNLDRYGVEFPTQNEEIKQAIRNRMEQEGKWISRELLPYVELYYKAVWRFTNKQPINLLENFNLRGLAGIEGAFQLDHKISIKFGFENNIPPYIIGNIHNLEMLPWRDNIYKSSKCSIPFDELCSKVF